MLMSDKWIKQQSLENTIIDPFVDCLKSEAGISYGLSSYGYDVRLSNQFKIFKSDTDHIVDPKNFKPACVQDLTSNVCIIPPNSFALGCTLETIKVPDDILVLCIGKSTYARCGIITNTTPLEPGWEGTITIEISNTTPSPCKVYANEGICQLLFFKGDQRCSVSYNNRNGKYMHQKDITLPRS